MTIRVLGMDAAQRLPIIQFEDLRCSESDTVSARRSGAVLPSISTPVFQLPVAWGANGEGRGRTYHFDCYFCCWVAGMFNSNVRCSSKRWF